MNHRTIRFADIDKQQPSTPGVTRPSCFGRHYDVHAVECKHECAHRASCAYAFSNGSGTIAAKSTAAPSRVGGGSTDVMAEEPLPDIVEVPAPDETFWSKLGYNMALQALTAFIREGLFAAQSVPRKQYFDHGEKK